MTYKPGTYRKKPVEVQAIRWMGPGSGDAEATVEDLQEWGAAVEPAGHWGDGNWDLFVATLEDGRPESAQVRQIASPGDWIVRGVAGEFYPVKPHIFEATYELVDR
jgi:hypothetical protein